MGASFHWQPTNKGKLFDVGPRSAFKSAIELVFGSMPVKIGPESVDKLRAMAASSQTDEYNRLANLIEQHGEIQLWAEY